ncbi:hypothetical protein HORIV_63630 [Vreelandella olivaria]|uniref:HTH gntR-type domain-containing protein n=1 Tax=Vreelandella olivaria TaxID=390919 RepID=A0ABN5XBL0_9GAMM|nr:hypothetical protein HORIV_63630 [Halomonas olivaria]
MNGLYGQDFVEGMCMTTLCLEVDPNAGTCLQEQLRKTLLEAIRMGSLPSEDALPSCRKLSQQLGISRNTVAIVYEKLVEDGYLISRPVAATIYTLIITTLPQRLIHHYQR